MAINYKSSRFLDELAKLAQRMEEASAESIQWAAPDPMAETEQMVMKYKNVSDHARKFYHKCEAQIDNEEWDYWGTAPFQPAKPAEPAPPVSTITGRTIIGRPVKSRSETLAKRARERDALYGYGYGYKDPMPVRKPKEVTEEIKKPKPISYSGALGLEVEALRNISTFHHLEVKDETVTFYLHDARRCEDTGRYYVPNDYYVSKDIETVKAKVPPHYKIWMGHFKVGEFIVYDSAGYRARYADPYHKVFVERIR